MANQSRDLSIRGDLREAESIAEGEGEIRGVSPAAKRPAKPVRAGRVAEDTIRTDLPFLRGLTGRTRTPTG